MSRSKRDILDTESMLERLCRVLYAHRDLSKSNGANLRSDAESLRRISMTLHRWHELECGDSNDYASWCIVRGEVPHENGFVYRDNGKPYFEVHSYNGALTYYDTIPDRESGAKRRLAKIMARYPSLSWYIQGDPRGCALYILRPGDVPAGESADAYYSRGIAVYR